jgi:hypothetical protein
MKTAMLLRQRGIMHVQNSTANNLLFNTNYTKDAAIFAIQRHQRLKKEDFSSNQEGPLTKSIRLLAALILRNLARNSDNARKQIKTYESSLTNFAFDMVEASNAIAACLWYLNN